MRGRVVLAVLAAALVAPAEALAVDHVWLSLESVDVRDGWGLSGAVASADYQGKEIVGLTLTRDRGRGLVERHALRVHLSRPTLSFDGRTGRWRANLREVTADLRLTAKGAAAPVAAEVLGCRGDFRRVFVHLTGSFALRTGSSLGAIRRVRLAGTVTFAEGPVACGAGSSVCVRESTLAANTTNGTLLVDLQRKALTLTFRDGRWNHVLEHAQVQLVGSRIVAERVGTVIFSAKSSAEAMEGACRVTTTTGLLTGTLRARFGAWGTRTFRAGSAERRDREPA